MGIELRRLLQDNDNTIDDILRVVGMSTSSFDYDKSINQIVGNAPVNPFAENITDFFSSYDRGPFEMAWFRGYDHLTTYSASNFSNNVNDLSTSVVGVNSPNATIPNTAGYNTRPHLMTHTVAFTESGAIQWVSGSLMSFTYRTSDNSNQRCNITTIKADAAASIYNGNVDTETVATTVQSFGVAALDRTFATSSMGVVAYRNSADGADTWARVFKVNSAGTITFENAVEISTKYNQLFNKGLNVGQNKAVFSSMRGGNDINLHYFKYNGANNYTRGSVQVASTQHAGYPTMAYINDDLVAYIYTRRPSNSGEDRYINLKLYDTSTFPPTLLGTATEYDTSAQRISRMGDAAISRHSGDSTKSFGVFIYNDTSNYKGQAIPFEITTDQESAASSPTVRILPTGTAILSATSAGSHSDIANSFKMPHHLIPLGIPSYDTAHFYYLCIIAPSYAWTFRQQLSTGKLSTVREDDLTTHSDLRRADYHYYSANGNGHRGVPAGGLEWTKVSIVGVGEIYDTQVENYKLVGGGILVG